MIISRLIAKNWRNFQHIDVPMRERQFIIGPNASGKSNLLDIFRFLRDIVKVDGGGFQRAVSTRGGVSNIRCLAARQSPEIGIDIQIANSSSPARTWRYALEFRQETRGHRRTLLKSEQVWKGDKRILNRPDKADNEDEERLTQTFLEQVNTNVEFREIAKFFQSVTYLHLVPQLLRFADTIQGQVVEADPFGQGFLQRVAEAHPSTRRARLRKIEAALKDVVPQFKQLEFKRDSSTGRPHLRALYSHWRRHGVWQHEDQFSDGTLRLIGLLWSLLEHDSVLLLEEPELSLDSGIISQIPALISQVQRHGNRQIFVSTHSEALLTDPGIDGTEVLKLEPKETETAVRVVSDIEHVQKLLEAGLSVGEVVLSKSAHGVIKWY